MSVHSRGWEVCKACCCLEGSSFSEMIPFIGAMHGIFYKHHNHVAALIARKLGPNRRRHDHAAHVCMHSGAVMGSCRMPWHMSHAKHSAMPCKDLCTTSPSSACCPEGPATSAVAMAQTLQSTRDHAIMSLQKAQHQGMPAN